MPLFWDRHARRLRALWRLLAQLALQISLIILFSTPLSIAFGLTGSEAFAAMLLASPVFGAASTVVVGASTMLSVLIAARWLDQRPLRDLGLQLDESAWWRDLAFGLGLGAALMTGIFGIQLALGWVVVTGAWVAAPTDWPFVLALGLPIATFVMVGVYEEVLSRGYQLKNLAEGFGWLRLGPRGALLAAYLVSSAIFGALHATNPNATVISTLNITLAGVLLGAGMALTGRLAISIGLHITWNLFQGTVFGFPVSGISGARTTVLATQPTGPEIWTGGAFGPEAGILGIVAIGVGAVAILGWVRWREGAVRLHTGLAQYRPRRAGAQPTAIAQPSAAKAAHESHTVTMVARLADCPQNPPSPSREGLYDAKRDCPPVR